MLSHAWKRCGDTPASCSLGSSVCRRASLTFVMPRATFLGSSTLFGGDWRSFAGAPPLQPGGPRLFGSDLYLLPGGSQLFWGRRACSAADWKRHSARSGPLHVSREQDSPPRHAVLGYTNAVRLPTALVLVLRRVIPGRSAPFPRPRRTFREPSRMVHFGQAMFRAAFGSAGALALRYELTRMSVRPRPHVEVDGRRLLPHVTCTIRQVRSLGVTSPRPSPLPYDGGGRGRQRGGDRYAGFH